MVALFIHTLEDDQARLEARVGRLYTLNLRLQIVADALSNGRAIDLCPRHFAVAGAN